MSDRNRTVQDEGSVADIPLPPGRDVHDPRPSVIEAETGPVVVGVRCTSCAYPAADPFPRCPVCAEPVERATFSPLGTVFSSTVVRIPIPGRTPPYGVAYVDLDDGPRIVAHVAGSTEAAISVGSRARVTGLNDLGDVMVAEVMS